MGRIGKMAEEGEKMGGERRGRGSGVGEGKRADLGGEQTWKERELGGGRSWEGVGDRGRKEGGPVGG